jgi:hypothetical protein
MPEFEHTPDTQVQTVEELVQTTTAPQKKLFVVAFKDFSLGEPTIITQPGGRLFTGTRTVVRSIERDATEIAKKHQITATAHAWLHLADGQIPHTQGYSVERATHSPLPDMADFTTHATPTAHDLPLELHSYSRLLNHLSGDAELQTEAAYLRAFGDFVLNRTR